MRTRTTARPSLEALEDRWCPAVTATVRGGHLLVEGAATTVGDTIAINQTAAETFEVKDGDKSVGTFTGVKGDVRVGLGAANDKVAIDLGGLTTGGSVRVGLGGGDNSVRVGNGTIKGSLNVTAGVGADSVSLGDGSKALTVQGDVWFGDRGGPSDKLSAADKVTVRSLTAVFVNDVTLAAGSSVGRSVVVIGGTSGNKAVFAGTIGGDLGFTGSGKVDDVTLTGKVGKDVGIATFGDKDSISIGGEIGGHLVAESGDGDDTLTLSGKVAKTTTVSAGRGNDTATIAASAKFEGRAEVLMGDGDDKVTLADGATIVRLLVNGGRGTDTFVGNRTLPGLKLEGFEA